MMQEETATRVNFVMSGNVDSFFSLLEMMIWTLSMYVTENVVSVLV